MFQRISRVHLRTEIPEQSHPRKRKHSIILNKKTEREMNSTKVIKKNKKSR